MHSSWRLRGYLQELADISKRNEIVDSSNGFKFCLQLFSAFI
jgi:hypothetical protein